MLRRPTFVVAPFHQSSRKPLVQTSRIPLSLFTWGQNLGKRVTVSASTQRFCYFFTNQIQQSNQREPPCKSCSRERLQTNNRNQSRVETPGHEGTAPPAGRHLHAQNRIVPQRCWRTYGYLRPLRGRLWVGQNVADTHFCCCPHDITPQGNPSSKRAAFLSAFDLGAKTWANG